MPAIQDPGELLVTKCLENKIKVIPLPGPFAGVTALAASGLSTERFTFIGFLPKKQNEKIKVINEFKLYKNTLLIYEAPHRLEKTLLDLYTTLGNRKICIAREITKEYEEFLYLTLKEAIAYYKNNKAIGEFTIIIEGSSKRIEMSEEKAIKILKELKNMGIDNKTAIKITSKVLNINKNKVYDLVLEKD